MNTSLLKLKSLFACRCHRPNFQLKAATNSVLMRPSTDNLCGSEKKKVLPEERDRLMHTVSVKGDDGLGGKGKCRREKEEAL